jgi:hypothetical protein
MTRFQRERLANTAKKPTNWLVIAITISALVALIVLMYAQANTMPAFIPSQLEYEDAEPLQVQPLVQYIDESTGIMMAVPEGWRQATIRGNTSFVHENGTLIQLQISEYAPQINMMNADNTQWEVESNGGRFHDYVQLNNSSVVYSFNINGVETIQYYTWDRAAIVGLNFAVHEELYEHYFSTFMRIIDTLKWEKQHPIPDDFIMLYNEFGNFEFGVPATWSTALTEEGIFLATQPETGAVMYVNVVINDTSYEGVSQIEYTNFIGHGRGGFILREYYNDARSIYAEATYTSGGRQYVFLQHMISNGMYHYTFTLETPEEHIPEARHLFSTVVLLFRFG